LFCRTCKPLEIDNISSIDELKIDNLVSFVANIRAQISNSITAFLKKVSGGREIDVRSPTNTHHNTDSSSLKQNYI
jgi:hypothetical protein